MPRGPPRPRDLLGLAYSFRLQTGKAIEQIGKAIALDPGNGTYFLHLGKQHMLLMDHDAAQAAYLRAMELGLEREMPFYDLGIISERRNRLVEAREFYEKAVASLPRFAPAYLRLGMILEREGDEKRALELYAAALERAPDLAAAHYRTAQLYLREGRQVLAGNPSRTLPCPEGEAGPAMTPRLAPILLFALALGLRTAYILEIDDSPTFTHPPVDGQTYVKQAEAIAAGNWLGRGQEPFWQPPLYPYLLGLFRLFFEGDAFYYAVRLFQTLAGTGTCLLAWHLGRRLFHPGVGLAAGAAAAVYGPLIYFDGEILPASLATFLDLAGLALLLRCLRRPGPPGFLGAGALFGLASLTVPTVLSFAAAAAVFIWVKVKRGGPLAAGRLAFPAAFVLGVLLPILPVAVRNVTVGGTPSSSHTMQG